MKAPELPLSARKVLDTLKQLGVTHAVWLPDSESRVMYQHLVEDPAITLVPVAREGEAIAIAAGLLVAGKGPIVMVQSTGFFESGDSVRGIALDCRLPLVLLIGYRGYSRDRKPQDSAALYLEPILKAWGIPYYVMESDDDIELLVRAHREAHTRPGPVAVLVAGEYR